jgi:hypothetical protein
LPQQLYERLYIEARRRQWLPHHHRNAAAVLNLRLNGSRAKLTLCGNENSHLHLRVFLVSNFRTALQHDG